MLVLHFALVQAKIQQSFVRIIGGESVLIGSIIDVL